MYIIVYYISLYNIKHTPHLTITPVVVRCGDYYDEMFPMAQGGRLGAEQLVLTSSSPKSLHWVEDTSSVPQPPTRPSLRPRSADWGQNYIFPRTQVSKGRKIAESKECGKLCLCSMPRVFLMGIPTACCDE